MVEPLHPLPHLQERQPAIWRNAASTENPEWLIQMENVLEVLNQGIVVMNDHREILFANSRFLEMTCLSSQDLQDSGPSRLYSAQEWEFLMQQGDVALKAGQNRYAFVLPRKDGSRLPVIVSSRVLRNSGTQFGIITFTDISEQVRAEDQLRSANDRLQQRQIEIEADCVLPCSSRTASRRNLSPGTTSRSIPSIIQFIGSAGTSCW